VAVLELLEFNRWSSENAKARK